MDGLCGAQLTAQEVSGVMVAEMLRQQGTMQQVAVWELEVGDAMQEMTQILELEEREL